MSVRIITGEAREVLCGLPAESVHCVVSSPPYWGLRAYGTDPQIWGGDPACEHGWQDASWRSDRRGAHDDDKLSDKQRSNGGALGHRGQVREQSICRCGAWRGELGLEPDYRMYVEHIVEVFREVWRVLRPDGTVFLNLGDCYATNAGIVGDRPGGGLQGDRWAGHESARTAGIGPMTQPNRMPQKGLKPKDLMGMPWRVAFALQDDGWWLRSEITWCKKAPMPESVQDRPTSATEKIFLLTKSERYFYDTEAVKEPSEADPRENWPGRATILGRGGEGSAGARGNDRRSSGGFPPRGRASGNKNHKYVAEYEGSDSEEHRTKAGLLKIAETAYPTRNLRNFWLLGPEPYPEAHFATFVTEIPRRAILAGTSAKGVCPSCGAPWVRQIKRVGGGHSWHDHTDDLKHGTRGQRDGKPAGTIEREGYYEKLAAGGDKTIGWSPSCVCAPSTADPVPSTVLDPFGGAGTTGLVADRLGRDAILIELNPTYAEMSRKRLKKDAGMFADIAAD